MAEKEKARSQTGKYRRPDEISEVCYESDIGTYVRNNIFSLGNLSSYMF